MNLSKLIEEIKIILARERYDPLHDICHHYDTWRNCIDIIQVEDLKVDKIFLEIAAWLHDYETYNKDNKHEKLRTLLKKHRISDSKIKKIIQIIEEHSFSKTQTLIESEILFDADKLEHVSLYRWEYVLQAYKDGLFRDEAIAKYEKTQERLLKEVNNRLHFEYSKGKYRKLKKKFIEFAIMKGILVGDKIIMKNLKH